MALSAADVSRVIVHLDIDCMYAQVETLRCPGLRGRAVGVVQKQIVVTCNYAARALGVAKLMAVKEARRRGGDRLTMVDGSDLTPYRRAAQQVRRALVAFGAPCAAQGLDECTLDVTALAHARLEGEARDPRAQPQQRRMRGFEHRAADGTAAENRHRVMDLRSAAADQDRADEGSEAQQGPLAGVCYGAEAWARLQFPQRLLCVGSQIAEEMRLAIRSEAGLTASAGVAHNPLLAKLVAGLHKPDAQTVLHASEAAAFVAPLPCRALRGVGFKTDAQLRAAGMATVEDMRRRGLKALEAALGGGASASAGANAGARAQAVALFEAAHGRDATPVEPSANAPPASLTVEDSFKQGSLTTLEQAAGHARRLLADLLRRGAEDAIELQRRPARVVVKWRHREASRASRSGWGEASAVRSRSEPAPSAVGAALDAACAAHDPRAAVAHAVAAAVCESFVLGLLRQEVPPGACVTLLSVGFGSFDEAGSTRAAGSTVADLLGATRQGQPRKASTAREARPGLEDELSPARPLSKREAREEREGGGGGGDCGGGVARPPPPQPRPPAPPKPPPKRQRGAVDEAARGGGGGDGACDSADLLAAVDRAEQRLLMAQFEQRRRGPAPTGASSQRSPSAKRGSPQAKRSPSAAKARRSGRDAPRGQQSAAAFFRRADPS